jgi:hypothetical protein
MAMRRGRVLLVLGFLVAPLAAFLPALPADTGKATALRFEVTRAKGLTDGPQDGRLLVALGRQARPEPRRAISAAEVSEAPPFLGRDVDGFAPGMTAVVDANAAIFPYESLSRLPRGEYYVQAVFDTNRDLRLPDAPGNLYSEPRKVLLDPSQGEPVRIELNRAVPPEELPRDTEQLKYVKIRSELLSRFHGRPIFLRAAVLLPRGFDEEKDRRYPLRVHIGGFGTRYTAAAFYLLSPDFRRVWMADDAPRMLLLHLDGAGPFGDPYQVNSANNGPYGDAVTQELIPYVEEKFRGVGAPHARVLDGGSTGGWVSLALQVFYPDFFNGCWSQAPDPVDFRAYELINIYEDDNAYVNRYGFERPGARDRNGDTRWTVRYECRREVVLGRGGRWWLSGKDWCSWNAVFGPRGDDGLPRPLWDGRTGRIDRGVLEHWKRYDLRLHLEKNWAALGPKLRGKVRVRVGEADDYFLNNAVHLLEESLRQARPAFEGQITFVPRAGHGGLGTSQRQMMAEMAAALEKGRP